MLSGIHDELERNLYFVGDVLAANLVLAEAKGAALFGASRAFTPANGAYTVGIVLTWLVAESTALFLILVAGQRGSGSAGVRVLGTGDANIGHAGGAVRRADAAADIMEVLVTRGVPEGAPLFAASALVHLTSTSTVSIGLVAVSAIIAEAGVRGAALPANGTDAIVARLTVGVAKSSVLLFVISAGGEWLTSCAAIGLFPARVGHIGVVVVMMEVMDRGTVVVLFSMSERLLRVVSIVGHMLLILII